ncbi:MAG: histidine phosphatase family protein [bacterium]|nr:histidine phosphatase family protein [bacterium]
MLGRRLQHLSVPEISCSDLLRANQTADIVNTYLQCGITLHSALREIHMGELFWKSWDDLERETPGVSAEWHRHEWDMPYPGGECGADVKNRCMPVVQDIFEKQEEHAVIVCHGGLIMILFSFFLDVPFEKRFHMRIDNCSISTVEYHADEKNVVVTRLNDTAHLVNMRL